MYRDDYLAHYGIKGMKWGIRKVRPNSERRFGRKKRARKEAIRKYNELVDNTQADADRGKISYTKGLNKLRKEAYKIEDRKVRSKALTAMANYAAHNNRKLNQEEFAAAKRRNPNLTWDYYWEEIVG